MDRYKLGFTLAEVLVALVIIGVIMAISVHSIKIVKSSYTSLAYFAHKNVVNMVGVLNSGASPEDSIDDSQGNPLPSMIAQCKKSNGAIVQVLKSDREYLNDFGTPLCSQRVNSTAEVKNLFCKSMTSISNTAGKTRCDSLFQTNLSSNDNSTSAFEEPYISNLDYNNPTFIATNGQRYYLSEWTYNSQISDTYGYRLIAVDLNGTARPNKTERDGLNPPPDIITFMIMDNGEVYPLGVAATNIELNTGRVIQYLNSKVKGYYYTYDPNRTVNVAPECTQVIKGEKQQTCNYAIVYLQNDEGTSFFNYRDAYCKSLGGKENAYSEYCNGITPSEYCPPSTSDKVFDLCTMTNVKPMFRYNFN
ncbi:TPA: prepilin-type N-terminal cleavage/methylation domain-containing protein [Candidatus Avigastranaerophilus faecigallinarum]|nr:prepilin-type N-terminal cleavage/methylation domain-containing protein [Candidatus Avigastranaerophilus faecigallinarum]